MKRTRAKEMKARGTSSSGNALAPFSDPKAYRMGRLNVRGSEDERDLWNIGP